MCGINGIIRFNGKVEKEEILKMNKAIKHRGPDDEGAFVSNNIGLGHVRLAILDLSEKGHQPMGLTKEGKIIYKDDELEKADYIIVYNGEVYNYKELIEKFNLKTETGTDTEIILRLYQKLGFDCVKEFNGMWAFAIYDKEKNILFCSRDRLGVKPFYYYWDGEEFIFSSELKGILAVKKLNKKENINKEAVQLYFALGFIPSPWTIYNKTFKLEAAHNLVLDLAKREIKKWRYWELPKYNPIYDKKKLIEEGKKLLEDAVRIRMRSDVPVGAFLSGGLDSSTVVAVMSKFTDLKKLHTFSIGFEGKYDETPYIKTVVDHLKTQHHHYYFKEKDFEELIDKYVWIYDEPFGDYSGFPTYKVSELAKKYVTVCLSGDGGDEVFAGYMNHLAARRYELIKRIPKILRKALYLILSKLNKQKKLNSFFSLTTLTEALRLSLMADFKFYSEAFESERISPKVFKNWSENNLKYSLRVSNNCFAEAIRVYDLLFNTLSDHFLVKVDRASMANALEVRSPFLDYRFAEFSQKIPIEWKVNLFKTKKLMREIIENYLPKEIVNRGKWGFTPPLEEWILKEKYLKEIENNLKVLKEIDKELYNFFKEKVLKNKDQKIYKIYLIRLFIFIKWWERWTKN
ncbi:asparagine synthase (glutamine-hydrolyzing) [Methanocaldococcus infernus ME]|uniref:Putative asparagine synthetase [glutamine-hydrolyzing] n=1 Tax=Methanocaldococcus infernus (strain DSM 11812 / JCM 15783 / ME) TaxID=573063 RepID=D5VU54_METIM|nr:asparagine synthase (glutamine-hydrolyzing) [Methanocaldococcus infernus]ADG14107.1 asparagine synthase (glutamine-hydrolyzing) [Methanocaldococcus infernus ME]